MIIILNATDYLETALENILASILEVLLGLATTFTLLIDALALRHPYPCVTSQTQTKATGSDGSTTQSETYASDFALQCGEEGLKQPLLFPFEWEGGPSISFANNLPSSAGGFWHSMAETHLFIVAVSITLLLFGVAVTYGLWAVGWGVSDRTKEKMGIYNLIKTTLLIILWWPIASFIMWAFEAFNMLALNIGGFTDGLEMTNNNLNADVTMIDVLGHEVPEDSTIRTEREGIQYTVKLNNLDITEELYDKEKLSPSEAFNAGKDIQSQFGEGSIVDTNLMSHTETIEWEEEVVDANTWRLDISKENFVRLSVGTETELETIETEAASQVYKTLEKYRTLLERGDADNSIAGSIIFVVLMIILIIPYIIISLILTLLWSLRILALVLLFLLMPLAFAIRNFEFKGMKWASDHSKKAFPLFIFLLIISMPVAMVGGLAEVMIFLASNLTNNIMGAPEEIQTVLFLMFIIWLPVIYGASPFLIAKYTSFSPSREFEELRDVKWTSLDNYEIGDMLKGDAEGGVSSNLRSGDVAGAITALSGKAQGGALDRLGKGEEYDTLGEASRGETVGKLKEGAEETKARAGIMGRSIKEEGSTLENYREKQNERAKMLEEKERRKDQEGKIEKRDEKYMELLDQEYRESEWKHLEEELQKGDVARNRGEIANEAFDLNAFQDVEGYDDMMNTMKDQLLRASEEGKFNDDDYVKMLSNVEDKRDLGKRLRGLGISEEDIDKEFSENDIESSDSDAALVEMLRKDGDLDTAMQGLMETGQVEFDNALHEDARETYNLSQHAVEHGIDVDELTPNRNVDEDIVQKFNGDYDKAETFEKAVANHQEVKAKKAKEKLEEIDNVREKMTSDLLSELGSSLESQIEDKMNTENIDLSDYDEEDKWRVLLEENEDIDVESMLEESGFDLDDDYVESFTEAFKEQWDDFAVKNRDNLRDALRNAKKNARENVGKIDNDELSEYGEHINLDNFGDDIESVEDLEENFGKEIAEKQLEMMGMVESMSIGNAIDVIEQGNYDKKELIQNALENFNYENFDEKEKFVKFGEKMKELEKEGKSLEEILD